MGLYDYYQLIYHGFPLFVFNKNFVSFVNH